ncbi:uncharacterized protein LOC116003863 [Ipomoea triloba]|uniref:uncharacterized protein LOC116003863 n=1 Tax=Ipomoea triloba TaxID=35885 RepID=UPI00125E6B62|nr:uncharacterized protein LOC116003863 [Ipomoea triloba]
MVASGTSPKDHPPDGGGPSANEFNFPDVAMMEDDGRLDPADTGAASSSFRRALSYLILVHRPSIVCFLEPKVSGAQASKICSNFGFEEWVRVEAVGFSGGIWVLWKGSLNVEIIETHPQFITLQMDHGVAGVHRLTLVYGSPNLYLRRRLFSDLSCCSLNFQGPWLLAGDFNSVTSREEVNNPECFSLSRCTDFNNWLFREGLIDLGYIGAKFTWMRGVNSSSFRGARLDRALSNIQWKLCCPNTVVEHLPMIQSDHSPLLITTDPSAGTTRGNIFRFNMAWAVNPGFLPLIHHNWKTDKSLEANKSDMAKVLTEWNKNTVGNIFQNKNRLLARIGGVQKRLTSKVTPELIRLDRKLRLELEETLHQEELIWFQRSRESWITSGDRNTRFYHIATTIKSNQKKIKALKDDDGSWVTEENEVRGLVRNYFERLYTEEALPFHHPLLPGKFPKLSETEWEFVNASPGPCKLSEKRALFDMEPCKAPGLDGFAAGFYQKTWSITGKCLVRFARHFFEVGSLPPGSNDTIISLIPKVGNLELVNQLRLIGLCNISYKLLTKAMTNRLKEISKNLIGQHQTSFVPGRLITDNILVFQEVLHSMKYKQGAKGWMIVKLDLEKAYDRLSWKFLEETLRDIGFNHNWTRNIMECVSTPRLAVLWNGQKSDWFTPQRGLRQGDSISPLLFVLCMERLSHLILDSIKQEKWKWIKICRNGPHVSHLFFADDLILFGEATMEQAVEMKKCLDAFCANSGQKISLHKSSVFFSKNTNPVVQQCISATLDIPIVVDMGKYLGIPSLHGRLEKETFAGIIERVRGKLAGWKSKSLSFAGRHTLVQSVLSAIPYYTMQSTLLPVGVTSAIEKIIRDFLWGSSEGERKCHLVRWETVTKSKAYGGLGIRKMEPMNRAFLAKLGWRLIQNEDSIWSQIFKAKYSVSSTDCSTWKAKANMSNAWKGILRSVPILQKGIRITVRNGRRTSFWTDCWLGDKPLCQEAINAIPPGDLGRLVASYWSADRGWRWESLNNLLPEEILSKLAAYVLHEEQNLDDIVGWKLEASGCFSVSSAYDIATRDEGPPEVAKWNSIWKLKVPNRIRTFMWLVKHNKIMTNENRVKRGMTESDSCWFCTGVKENTEHVLRLCPLAEPVWRSVLPAFVERTRLFPFSKWLEEGISDKGDGRQPSNVSSLFSTTLWWIWKWRNDAIFNSVVKPLHAKTSWISTQVGEFNRAFFRAKGPPSRIERNTWQKFAWTKPQDGYVKVNVDGAVDITYHKASCGGLIRDGEGSWKQGYAYNIGNYTPLEAEAWALLKGVQLASHLGFNRVTFESDSTEVVSYLTRPRPPTIAAHNILEACKRELRAIEVWQITLIVREQNQAADSLAKLARSLHRGLHIFDSPPESILGFLEDDRCGLPV